MVKRSVLGGANAAQAFATCRREASSCLGKTVTRLVIKARRLFPRTATRPVDQNHKPSPASPTLLRSLVHWCVGCVYSSRDLLLFPFPTVLLRLLSSSLFSSVILSLSFCLALSSSLLPCHSPHLPVRAFLRRTVSVSVPSASISLRAVAAVGRVSSTLASGPGIG